MDEIKNQGLLEKCPLCLESVKERPPYCTGCGVKLFYPSSTIALDGKTVNIPFDCDRAYVFVDDEWRHISYVFIKIAEAAAKRNRMEKEIDWKDCKHCKHWFMKWKRRFFIGKKIGTRMCNHPLLISLNSCSEVRACKIACGPDANWHSVSVEMTQLDKTEVSDDS